MIKNPEDFEIKYWAGGNDFESVKQRPKRSIKKKLVIVISFVGTLALFPMFIFGLSNIDFKNSDEVVIIQTPIAEENIQNNNVSHKQEIIEEKVINNDSWWKISKRVCGQGRLYLAISEQNNGKALFEGDTVTVDCSIN